MKLVRLKEYLYIKKNMRKTLNITLESKNTGITRIYMVPPKSQWNRTVPYIVIINGQKMLSIGISWAVMLQCLMKRLRNYGSRQIDKDNYEILVEKAILDTKQIYPAIHIKVLQKEMKALLDEIANPDKMAAVSAFHSIQSEKEYVKAFTKTGNDIWQYPNVTMTVGDSYKIERINGVRK